MSLWSVLMTTPVSVTVGPVRAPCGVLAVTTRRWYLCDPHRTKLPAFWATLWRRPHITACNEVLPGLLFMVLGLQQDSFSCYAESRNPCLSQMAHSFYFNFSVAVWLQSHLWLLYVDPHSVKLLNWCLILNIRFCFGISILKYFLYLVWFEIGCSEGCLKFKCPSPVMYL